MTPATLSRPRSTAARATASVGVCTAGFVLGGATSFAQGFLPSAVASFANSSSGWTLVTVLLVAAARVGPALSAVLGAASFVLLTVGYSAASALRGLTYDPTLFAVVGLVVGPVVGLATAWLRTRDVRAALGTAALAGIGLGEAAYGLTAVAASTSPVYWVLMGCAAVTLLVSTARRVRSRRDAVLAVVLTVVVAGAFLLAYQGLLN
ncbi:DUF6518 family protein [Kineococcus rhizosphaerae]|uniref:Uncharacterized protein n=1 Tax=Kineococcus rhizosphaerae TaxID=559628 RepID=A0A2T0QX89_9ACTN|nr:DUF6518 family protein [Kineococcus rhizosphaerae]PRY10470.1 hypothetical protein CLV37_11623 [Kineococcus rhizosphaerae]